MSKRNCVLNISSVTRKSIWFYFATFLVTITGCAGFGTTTGDQLNEIIKSGNCSKSETFARESFTGSDVYLALAGVEANCRRNNVKAFEYLDISARMGNKNAADLLKKYGRNVPTVSVLPAPPVHVTVNPTVTQPIQLVPNQSTQEQCVILDKNIVQCGNRQCFNLGGIIQCQ